MKFVFVTLLSLLLAQEPEEPLPGQPLKCSNMKGETHPCEFDFRYNVRKIERRGALHARGQED